MSLLFLVMFIFELLDNFTCYHTVNTRMVHFLTFTPSPLYTDTMADQLRAMTKIMRRRGFELWTFGVRQMHYH